MTFPESNPKFLVDKRGRKTAVQLSIRDYERLLEACEDAADIKDYYEARKATTGYISAEELQRRLRKRK